MDGLEPILKSKWMHILSSLLISLIWSGFAYAHILAFLIKNELSLLLAFISETLIVIFFVFRSKPQTISVNLLDWLVALTGTFFPLFFRPAASGVFPPATFLMLAAALFQLLSIVSLNRSFALVAAKRKIKTQWMYRCVRHPLYSSYCFLYASYVLSNTSLENSGIFIVAMLCLFIRIFREEKHLSLDPLYTEYMLKVRYRLIPYLF